MPKTRARRADPLPGGRRGAGAARRSPRPSAEHLDLAALLRGLPGRLSANPPAGFHWQTLARAACTPLDPRQVAEVLVRTCAGLVPGTAWAVYANEWVASPRCLASVGWRGRARETAGWLAQRVIRTGSDVSIGNLADETPGGPAAAGLGFALAVRGQTRLALVGCHPSPVRQGFRVSLATRRALDRAIEVPLLALDTALRLERAEALSVTDDLTRLFNARFLAQVLRREVKRSARTQQPLALLFLDLDGFKAVNDAHGHVAGSRALVEAAHVVRDSARESDVVARYGGDEFAVVLPETDEAGARHVAERIRERVARHVFLALEGLDIRLTVSIGIAALPGSATTADGLVQAADEAMYWIKARGKDGIHLAAAESGQDGRR